MAKLEGDFYRDDLLPALENRFPGIVCLKLEPGSTHNGIPDHICLYEDKWAMLETKRGRRSAKQPHQDHYVEKYGEMSYAAFVNPDNMYEVLDDLQETFGVGR